MFTIPEAVTRKKTGPAAIPVTSGMVSVGVPGAGDSPKIREWTGLGKTGFEKTQKTSVKRVIKIKAKLFFMVE